MIIVVQNEVGNCLILISSGLEKNQALFLCHHQKREVQQ